MIQALSFDNILGIDFYLHPQEKTVWDKSYKTDFSKVCILHFVSHFFLDPTHILSSLPSVGAYILSRVSFSLSLSFFPLIFLE